ncbi:MAG: hypothetical protein KGL16_14365, partial [Acidobacteriota bacterium]|nr:hypothetical protein [Acidobacteriota bacterium]
DSFATNSKDAPGYACYFGSGSSTAGEDGSLHGYTYPLKASLTLSMSVRADNPVGITFAGYARGLIDVTSNANVYLDGTLTNPSGDTNITVTNGSIIQPSSQSSVLLALLHLGGTAAQDSQPPIMSNNLTLIASGGVGSPSAPISATMTPNGTLNGSSGSAGFFLTLGSGAGIGSVTAGSSGNWGDVNISGAGSLLRSSPGTSTNVSGRNITLTTSIGSIGAIAANEYLVIAAHATALANGGFNNGFVDAEAIGDIGLTQVSGDLIVTAINSQSGDVWVLVTSGGIYNRYSQTPAQVLSESDGSALWARLQLTSALGVSNIETQTVDAYQTQVDQAYLQYWQLRDNSTSYTSDTVTLSSQGVANMRSAASAALGSPASDSDVQAYAQSLYAADVALFDGTSCTAQNRCTPGIDPTWRTESDFVTFNSGFQYTATPTQVTSLTQNAEWTDSELKYFVNRTALEPSAGTPVPPTTPNIHGNNVTLHSSSNIGHLAAPIFVSAADIQNGTLTDEQAAALALASAPGDVVFVGLDSMGHTIEFSYDGSHTLAHYGVVSITGLYVAQLAPLFVGATGTFNATSDSGTVYVQSTSPNLNLGQVNAATDASLITAQNIDQSATSASSPQIITGGDLTLLAGAGDIAASHSGSTHSPLQVSIGGTLLSASAGQLLDLQETTGDLRFARIASGAD